MSNVFVLLVDKHSTRNKDFSELITILERAGVQMTINLEDGYDYDSVVFAYDPETVHMKQSRCAGRKPIEGEGVVSVFEAKKMLETMTADEVAAKLGISRATLYRRLKLNDRHII